jgi:hypothetical protein
MPIRLAAVLLGASLGSHCADSPAIVREPSTAPAAATLTPPMGARPVVEAEGYELVVREPRMTLAVAESRDMDKPQLHASVKAIAATSARCLDGLGRDGTLGDGSARIVVAIGDHAEVTGMRVTHGDEPKAAHNLARCLIPALKSAAYLPTGPRSGFALEALWTLNIAP